MGTVRSSRCNQALGHVSLRRLDRSTRVSVHIEVMVIFVYGWRLAFVGAMILCNIMPFRLAFCLLFTVVPRWPAPSYWSDLCRRRCNPWSEPERHAVKRRRKNGRWRRWRDEKVRSKAKMPIAKLPVSRFWRFFSSRNHWRIQAKVQHLCSPNKLLGSVGKWHRRCFGIPGPTIQPSRLPQGTCHHIRTHTSS